MIVIPGQPTRYSIKVEYPDNKKTKSKMFVVTENYKDKHVKDNIISLLYSHKKHKVYLTENGEIKLVVILVGLSFTVIILLGYY